MFKCLRSPKIAPDPGAPLTAEHMKAMSKQELIKLCLETAEGNRLLTTSNQRMDAYTDRMSRDNEEKKRMFNDHKLTSEQLQTELRREIAILRESKASLEQERDRINRSEAGLRCAVTRQMREMESLRNDIHELQFESKPPTPRVAYDNALLKNIKDTLQEAEDILEDKVTFELMTDPITLFTGHTFNRSTLVNIRRYSPHYDGFRCPITKQMVRINNIEAVPKSIIVTKLTDLFLAMKTAAEAHEALQSDADTKTAAEAHEALQPDADTVTSFSLDGGGST